MPEKEGAEEKTTKSVVNKKQKQMMGEEGYDVARDEGRVKPSKDKKDATSYPVSDEMKKTKKENEGPSALELVKKKYGKAVMDIKKESTELLEMGKKFGPGGDPIKKKGFIDKSLNKLKTNIPVKKIDTNTDVKTEETKSFNLTKVAEAFGGYIIERTKTDPIDDFINAEDPFNPQATSGGKRKNLNRTAPRTERPYYRKRNVTKFSTPIETQRTKEQELLDRYNKNQKNINVNRNSPIRDTYKIDPEVDKKFGRSLKQSRTKPFFKTYRDKASKFTKAAGQKLAPITKTTKKVIGNLTKGAKGLMKGGIAKRTVGRALGKGLAKQIPGIGQVLSGGEAIMRFASGDVIGGALSTLEMIPGLGMLAGTANVARDIGRARTVVKNVKKLKPLTKGMKLVQGTKTMRNIGSPLGKVGQFLRKNKLKTAIGAGGVALTADAIGDRMRRNIPKPSTPQGGKVGRRSAGSFTAA